MSPTSFQTAPPRGIIFCPLKDLTSANMIGLKPSGWGRIRTFESVANRFTVCPLWPLGNPSKYINFIQLKADDRTRTDNLLITSQLLCQLSHIGILSYSMQSYVLRPTALPIKFINKFYLKLRHIGITKTKIRFQWDL